MNIQEKIKRFYEDITSNNLIDQLPDYVAENCTVRVGEKLYPVGIEGMKEHLIAVRKTYPDLKMTVTRQYVCADTVISEFIMEGTHLGEWLGMQPSGKKLFITGVDIDRITDGKIVEHSGAANTFDAFFEAGIIKPA